MTRTPSRARLALAVAVVSAAALGAVLLVTGGAGASEGALSWKGKVQVFQSERPTDQVLYAQLANTGLREVELDVDRVRTYDAAGKEVKSATTFLAAFAHGIWGWAQKREATEFEKRRLGQIATLKPGQAVPITLSWRVPPGTARPARVVFGDGVELAIPTVATSPAP